MDPRPAPLGTGDAPPAPPTEPGAGDGRRARPVWLARLSSVVGLVIVVVAFGFVGRELAANWDEVRRAVAEASAGWVVAAFALSALAMASVGWTWHAVLALMGVRAPRARVVGWYFVGELGKYLPGGVWPVVGRGELAHRGGAPRTAAYASVALSLVTLYLAAMLTAVALLPFALGGDGPGGAVAVLALLPVGLVALHPRVIEALVAGVRRVTGRTLSLPVPRWGDSVGLVVRYLPSWVLVAGATTAVARALDPGAPLARVAFAVVLSWVAGFVAVPVPSGAGVREAVFVAACGLSPEIGAATAVIARVLFVVVDGAGAAVAAPLLRRSPPATVDVDAGAPLASEVPPR